MMNTPSSQKVSFRSFQGLAILWLSLVLHLFGFTLIAQEATTRPAHVIQISVDALGGKYLKAFLEEAPHEFPNFDRLAKTGAGTFNARTDYFRTSTLPNHTCMITGRPVETPQQWQAAKGHHTKFNSFSSWKKTDKRGKSYPESIHALNPEGKYTYSSFDVAHDHGLSTALYSSKGKFQYFGVSWGEQFGREHPMGRNKIDQIITGVGVHKKAMKALNTNRPAFAFLHYGNPDLAGHLHGYLGRSYRHAVKTVDGYLGELFALIDSDEEWRGETVLILSADHGGLPGTKGHGASDESYNYTIPFFVWGKGVAEGVDLYKLNRATRSDPGEGRPEYAPNRQPIRNGDGANLALKLLGLPAIPGSSINRKQDLLVR